MSHASHAHFVIGITGKGDAPPDRNIFVPCGFQHLLACLHYIGMHGFFIVFKLAVNSNQWPSPLVFFLAVQRNAVFWIRQALAKSIKAHLPGTQFCQCFL